jgi:uncharacterized protein (DUF488 family)
MTTLYTIGHGTLSAADFRSLLDAAGVRVVVDVRSFPGSRHNPQYGREEMERWLPEAGFEYRWMQELGGRRRPRPDSRNVALRNDGFRGYADYMETSDFRAGVDTLAALGPREPTAVMCSESVWWRCHRRLLADHLVLFEDIEVVHVMHDSRTTPHIVTDAARVDGDVLVYDVGATPPLACE